MLLYLRTSCSSDFILFVYVMVSECLKIANLFTYLYRVMMCNHICIIYNSSMCGENN